MRHRAVFCSASESRVSIHAPARGATLIKEITGLELKFQSTHPHGVRLEAGNKVDKSILFQSTHPHGVRRKYGQRTANQSTVSIHAPARGATYKTQIPDSNMRTVSIHAPARGATMDHRGRVPKENSFNPRTRTGCDSKATQEFINSQFQSTHPHGVRLQAREYTGPVSGFNPRTRTGCDLGLNVGFSKSPLFQSTHPHGVRRLLQVRKSVLSVSIHAPARGATMHQRHKRFLYGFQSTHPHGVRLYGTEFWSKDICFNPRTRTGCDEPVNTTQPLMKVSIHAPARGATHLLAYL